MKTKRPRRAKPVKATPPRRAVGRRAAPGTKVKAKPRRATRKPARISPAPAPSAEASPPAGTVPPVALLVAPPVARASLRLPGEVPSPTASPPPPAERQAAPQRSPLVIPPILLEGDEPPAQPGATGPGSKYALGPTPPVAPLEPQAAELPEAYGTGTLLLTARDPRCLYAHWDLTREQQRRYNALAADQHLVLRVSEDIAPGRALVTEIHVHPESQHWFVHVPRAAARYQAELGYYLAGGAWVGIATSAVAATPPETLAEDRTVQFATLEPAPPGGGTGVSTVGLGQDTQATGGTGVPLVQLGPDAQATVLGQDARATAEPPPPLPQPGGAPALGELASTLPLEREADRRAPRLRFLTVLAPSAAADSPLSQPRSLTDLVEMPPPRPDALSSADIAGLTLRELERGQQMASQAAAQLGQPALLAPLSSVTSPGGEGAQVPSPAASGLPTESGSFWLNVNAELVIYGATEPGALVTMGERPVRLRPDGSFSCRFALPDGNYELVVAAASGRGERREAGFKFSRATKYSGEVGVHPRDASLEAPSAGKATPD